jgi:hypothetical protein
LQTCAARGQIFDESRASSIAHLEMGNQINPCPVVRTATHQALEWVNPGFLGIHHTDPLVVEICFDAVTYLL